MSKFQQVVLATNNPKKLTELRRVVAEVGLEVEVLGLADFPSYPEPEETGQTFEENALIKAQAAARETGVAAVADDSGIEVAALNGMPGVRSARWAGPQHDDQDNLNLLLAQLAGVPEERRGARFVCALALVEPDGSQHVWEGVMPGRVITEPTGDAGFGYDPIFKPTGHQITTAQMDASEKDAISHRGIAVRAFINWLKET